MDRRPADRQKPPSDLHAAQRWHVARHETRVDVNGQQVNQHHVLSYFSITAGGTTVFEKTWGVKNGQIALDCSQTILDTVIVGTIHPLPGNDN